MKRKLLICLLTFSLALVWSMIYADDGFYVIPVKKKNYAPVPKTGQIIASEPYDDGHLRSGVAWPNPRFTENGNGTATDNLTGLIWLQRGNCTRFFFLDLTQYNYRTWEEAITACHLLSSGYCELSDGSQEGDWRLPNRKELDSLIDLGENNPSMPEGHLLSPTVTAGDYWSATTRSGLETYAWTVNFASGAISSERIDEVGSVRCVRGGQ